MSNTLAQAVVAVSYSNKTTVAATFGSSCTSGSRIAAAFTSERVGDTPTCADPTNGSYTLDTSGSATTSGSGQGTAAIFSVANTATSALTVTATPGGATYGGLSIFEITSAGGTPTLDVAASNVNSTSSNATWSDSVTTTAANDTIISAFVHNGTVSTGDTGYTLDLNTATLFFSGHASEHNIDVGTAGLKTINYGSVSTNRWSMAMAAYSPAAGGGAASQGPSMMATGMGF